MREFNYSKIKEQKWDSDIFGYIAAIYKETGKQEQYLKQRPKELEKLVEVAKVQSTEALNAIEGLPDTAMYWMSFTKISMLFRFPEIVSCNCIKSCTAT